MKLKIAILIIRLFKHWPLVDIVANHNKKTRRQIVDEIDDVIGKLNAVH